jgi:hypothetical protein
LIASNLASTVSLSAAVGTKASQSGFAALQVDVAGLPTVTEVDFQIDTKNQAQDIQTLVTFADRATTYNKVATDAAIATAIGGLAGGGYSDSQIDAFLLLKAPAADLSAVVSGSTPLSVLSVSGNGTITGDLTASASVSVGGIQPNPVSGTLYATTLDAEEFSLKSGEWKLAPSATEFKLINDVSGSAVSVLTVSNQGLNVGDTAVGGRLTANGITATSTSYVNGGTGLDVSSGNLAVGNMGLGMGSSVGAVSCHEFAIKDTGGSEVASINTIGNLSCRHLTQTHPSNGILLNMTMWGYVEAGWVGRTLTDLTTQTMGSFSYTPRSAQSTLRLEVEGYRADYSGVGADSTYFLQIKVDNVERGVSFMGVSDSGRENGDIHRVIGRHTVSSTTPVTIAFTGFRNANSGSINDNMVIHNLGSCYLTVWEYSR